MSWKNRPPTESITNSQQRVDGESVGNPTFLVAELYPQPRVRWGQGHPDPSTMTAEERLTEIREILAAGVLRIQKPAANE